MFTCTCSFKREELSHIECQKEYKIREKYQSVLVGKGDEPMEHPPAPSQDSDEFRESYLPQHPDHFNPIAGLHIRKVNMTEFNRYRTPVERRQLNFYTLRGTLPLPTAPYPTPAQTPFEIVREANLHACAHLYASDRNSLFLIPNHLDHPRDFTRMASLSHTVIFHVGINELTMPPEPRMVHPKAVPTLFEDGPITLCNLEGSSAGDKDGRKWFVQESWMERVAGGRGLHTSQMWDYDTGTHIATTIQDGLIRFKVDTKL